MNIKDDLKFKITILGSGTCVPSLERSSCAALVEISEKKILIDSGAGTIRRLLKYGVHINDIDIILYTHLHPDHTCEIIPFLFASKYGKKRDKKLSIYAGAGFKDFFGKLKEAYNQWIDPGDILDIIEIKKTVNFKTFSIDIAKVNHTPQSLAYKIKNRNFSIVYSGDTDYSKNLIDLAKNSDILISECSHPDELKTDGHLTPSLAGEIATKAAVKKLVLTHFYPECEKVDIEKECRKTYSGELILGKDLLTINTR
ncbi:MAG: MBL fold metallo-hydrolase [Desulfobacterales bacterium]|nr:MBL fold metallo-hydrolase [Desulfobacterales bacterium]MCP4162223.1 MBL fold metallo-hydrolase [Deltaproteobacteria bacterium]